MAYSGVDLGDRLFFLKLIFRWAGSVWQLLWVDLIFFVLIYIGINCLYRFALTSDQKANFENFVQYVKKLGTLTPLSFLLGFYVSAVIGRWWNICMTIPWLNAPAFYVSSLIEQVQDKEKARKLRLTIMRYMNLAWILCMRTISLQVYKRFRLPEEKNSLVIQSTSMARSVARNVTTLVTERKFSSKKKEKPNIRRRLEQINTDPQVKKFYGVMLTEKEMDAFVEIAEKSVDGANYQGEYWIPLQWCTRLLSKSREAELIVSQNRQYAMMVKMLNGFRGNLGTLTIYNDFNIPLVYTQVVVIAVYAFFLAEIFTAQQINPDATATSAQRHFDHYFPIFSIFKFIFFMGWFKTAICLMNPFGDDNNSIPTNEILDYNLMVGQKSGGAEDYLYPPFLHDDGEPCNQLDYMFENLTIAPEKTSSEEVEMGEEEGEDLSAEPGSTMLKSAKQTTNV